MTTTLIILSLAAILFVSGRIRSDLVAVCAALALVVCGVLTPEEALAGFSNPIVIMMLGLFVVGGGIFSTGLAKRLGTGILGLAGKSETKLFVLLMLTTAGVGAFVSNTGTVALMLPIVVSMARGAGLSSARLLMPLAFAGSMGGMLTLIGTPPNLIVRDALVAAGYEPLGFFSFTPVGIVCIVVGTLVLIPLTRRFLKERTGNNAAHTGKTLQQLASEYKVTQNVQQVVVTPQSRMVGHTLKELDVHGRYGVTVIEVRRQPSSNTPLGKVQQLSMANVAIEEGDLLFITDNAGRVADFITDFALTAADEMHDGKLHFYDVGMAEILLLPGSTLVGHTVGETDFRANYGLSVLGIRRHQDYLLDNLKDQRLNAADIVLVQGPWEQIARLNKHDGQEWVVIGQPEEQAARVTLDYKAPLAAPHHAAHGGGHGLRLYSCCPRHGGDAGCCGHDIYGLSAQCGGGLQNYQLGKHCAVWGDAAHVDGARKDGCRPTGVTRAGAVHGQRRYVLADSGHICGDIAAHLFHIEHGDGGAHGAYCAAGGPCAGHQCCARAHGGDGGGKHVFCIALLYPAQCAGDVGWRLQAY